MRRLADAARRRLQRSWWQPRPDALARALWPLTLIYAWLLARQRLTRPQRIGAPVLVVGNLIVGGAGKTPTVIALVKLLRAAGWTPGVVSRGYGGAASVPLAVGDESQASDCGDEPLLIRLRTRAPVIVGRDRVAAGRELLARFPQVDIVVCDDGLQHWALARDVQVVVFDERGAGNGLLLPAGPLREPLPARVPAATLVLYNASAPSTPLQGWTARRGLAGVCPLAEWWAGSAPQPLALLHGRPVLAAAGIAEPERFFRLLEAQGLNLRRCPLPDHHDFASLPWPASEPEVVITEKDAVKLRPDRVGAGATRVWVAALDFDPDPAFNAALLQALPTR